MIGADMANNIFTPGSVDIEATQEIVREKTVEHREGLETDTSVCINPNLNITESCNRQIIISSDEALPMDKHENCSSDIMGLESDKECESNGNSESDSDDENSDNEEEIYKVC